jgi:cobyrinic acid a,c-diamide synthase
MKTLLIAGDRSGSGKTSITLALAALLRKRFSVQTFKVGMDYIDPSYLTGVTGRPCRNLDGYVMTADEIRGIYNHGCQGAEVALVEGVRGLYEGAEALSNKGSTAEVARLLDLNVVLVINARSITRSAAAIVKGFMAFDPEVKIRGVILNNVMGERHKEKAITAVEHYCGVPVIGAIPRLEEMHLAMRHLGLVPYREGEEGSEFRDRIQAITDLIGQYVSVDRLLELAGDVTPAPSPEYLNPAVNRDLTIGVAYDEAFNFYYAELFDILAAGGAEVVRFSPVHDTLPRADGYIFGGGYPELFGAELTANTRMREAVRAAALAGTPIYAECGGLMYLTEAIVLKQGWQQSTQEQTYRMCGVYAGRTVMPAARVVTYVEGSSAADSPMGASRFRGHAFHYSDVDLTKETRYAYTLTRGVGITGDADGALFNNTLGAYCHLHPVSSREMFAAFLRACRSGRTEA